MSDRRPSGRRPSATAVPAADPPATISAGDPQRQAARDDSDPSGPAALSRRRFVALLSAAGVGAAAAPAALPGAEAPDPAAVSRSAVAAAEQLAGLELTDPDRDLMLKGLGQLRDGYRKLRTVSLANDVSPALRFDPSPFAAAASPAGPAGQGRAASATLPHASSSVRSPGSSSQAAPPAPDAAPPADLESLAFLPATGWGPLLRARQVTSVALTRMYLARLQKYDPLLKTVVNLTAERALAQAELVDREIAAGRYRGPLHGIPWGAKDLLAAKGYPTTWGSVPFKNQVIDLDATVVERLDRAGAVLVAKLSLGELALGDVWYGGTTHNPWKPEQGSSGSSAGPAAATAAGLVGFSIGSETLGSIVSPCTRNGATGLRPTFGRVSRHGAMALAWSMDKIGPICRSVEDCAAVFAAIHGPDGQDPTVADRPFAWDPHRDVRRLRVGYLRSAFEAEPKKEQEEWHALDLAALDALRALGIELRPIELPKLPVDALRLILTAEAAASFDELTRSGRDRQLVRQTEDAWPTTFRLGQTIPAVAYIQANRVRTLLMREMASLFADLDAYVAPSFGGGNLLLTNLTGHPAVVLPNGFRKDGTPTSFTFTGNLYGEADLLVLAKAYQEATGFHLRHPELKVSS